MGHDSYVELLEGPDEAVYPGETFEIEVAVLPQSNFPTAITQIYLFIGLKGDSSEIIKLYDGVPGRNPQVFINLILKKRRVS